jgi:hypothetical protein
MNIEFPMMKLTSIFDIPYSMFDIKKQKLSYTK